MEEKVDNGHLDNYACSIGYYLDQKYTFTYSYLFFYCRLRFFKKTGWDWWDFDEENLRFKLKLSLNCL